MRMDLRVSLASGAAALCLLAVSHTAQADTDTTADAAKPVRVAAATTNSNAGGRGSAATGTSGIETVVVTAEKRAETSQKVAIPLSALDGGLLDSMGVTGFKELGMRVPSLRFGAGVTGGENVITMRGLGSQNTTPGGDSPVAYSVDGVTLQRTTSVDPEFYDVERIEVLRGPQGTLYGRNSVGGSINVITNKPTDTLGGGVDVLVGDYSARIFRGWANAPLIDDPGFKMYVRLTGVSAEHDPYAKNLSTAPGATHSQDGQDFQMLRGQIYMEFSPDLNVQLSASSSDNKDPAATNVAWWEVPTRYMTAFNPGDKPITPGSPCDFSTAAKYQPRVFCHDYPENATNRVSLYSGTVNWNLGWATVTSVTGYSTSKVNQTSDGDGSDVPMAFGAVWLLKQQQISQEIRLASTDEASPLKWIAGLYYFWANNYEDFSYVDTGLNDDFSGYFGLPGSNDQYNFFSHGNTKTESFAPFGQIDYDLSKTSWDIPLTITLGARYSDDRKYGFNYLDYQSPVFCGGSCGVISGPFSKSWGQWTGKAGLTYQIDSDVMAYASASRGYISGGNIIGLATIYGPESMWSYDVGLKSRFWDDHVQLNLAGYHEEISHLQVFVQSGTQSGINNVDGITQVNGLEAELDAIPIDNLRFNATLSLNRSTYGNYFTVDTRYPGLGPACSSTIITNATGPHYLCNFKGNTLNQTPPFTLDLGAEYTFNTPFGTITPRVDTFISDKVQFLPDNNPLSTQKSYTLTNLHLTWLSTDGHYKAEAFVNNIENADVISNDGLQSGSLGQGMLEPDNFVYYPPRTVGFRFGVNY